MPESQQPEHFDAVVIGAGIMGATLASLLSRLEPQWRIAVLERLPEAGLESSHAWNNAGTGHAGLCEFNYTPRGADGSVDVSSALTINAQFQQSCEYWAHLARDGRLGNPGGVIRPIPHHSFGQGSFGVGYLRARHQAMSAHPPFAAMEYTEDPELIAQWLPLMFDGRPADEQVAATRVVNGTDVDYGALARRLLADAAGNGVEIRLSEEVTGVSRGNPGWTITSRSPAGIRKTTSPYVFLGAGGATLRLLQLAGIPETRSFGGFPISGCFYRTSKPELLQRHRAKVYGHAAEGVPPISVPHLDSRFVDGQEYLMFGPYGAFSPRFLKSGSLWDLARSIRPANLPTLLSAARDNFPMVAYLVRQILQRPRDRFSELRRFVPDADPADWEWITAGQRVQVVKTVKGKGTIAGFGTEVVTSGDGSLAALLGASPGASASVCIILDVLHASFPKRFAQWEYALRGMIPSYGAEPQDDPAEASERWRRMARALHLDRTEKPEAETHSAPPS